MRGRVRNSPPHADVDFVLDDLDLVYAIRSGYRGANSYHNANRLTMKRLAAFESVCSRGLAWKHEFASAGEGWCRPTAGVLDAGETTDERECAQRCWEWHECAAFATDGRSCALYPMVPTGTSGSGGFSCWKRSEQAQSMGLPELTRNAGLASLP